MSSNLRWASAQFTIAAHVDLPRPTDVVATGDFAGARAAVLRGVLLRVAALHAPVVFDASGVTALSPDAVDALCTRAAEPERFRLVGVPRALAPQLSGRRFAARAA
ncbi:MAG TPA: hypothetical protein VKB75_01170 [Jatrophihabitans sp.]|nr:hypothetical protein [Jatrophihabitans sp.]